MSLGPGKFDHLLTEARQKSGGVGGILILFDTPAGPSFCCQLTSAQLLNVPFLLRHIADQIEKDIPEDLRGMVKKNS